MRARQLLLVLIVFALYGALVYSGYRIFLMALLLVIFLVLASLIQLLWVRRQVSVTQTLFQDPVFTDDAASLSVLVVNQSRWPVAALEIEFQQIRRDLLTPLPEIQPVKTDNRNHAKTRLVHWLHNLRSPSVRPLLHRRRIISVFGQSSVQEQIPLKTDDARIYRVGITQICLRDPFNLIRLPVQLNPSQPAIDLRLHVLPRPHEQLTFESLNRINAEGLHPSPKQADEINAIDDLRIMHPGDSLKRIHWIVSAKQNKWMIKTFEREEQGNILLLPDLANDHLPERRHQHHRKAILSVTAAAIRQLLAYDLALTLITSDQGIHVSYADRSDQLLDLLIQLSTTLDQPDTRIEDQAPEGLSRLPDEATVVIVSTHPDDALAKLTREMISTGHPVFLIYYHDPADKSEEPVEWFTKYQETGAGLIKVYEHETED